VKILYMYLNPPRIGSVGKRNDLMEILWFLASAFRLEIWKMAWKRSTSGLIAIKDVHNGFLVLGLKSVQYKHN